MKKIVLLLLSISVLSDFSYSQRKPSKEKLMSTFSDERDGHAYKMIQIGSQIWMAENLAFKTGGGCWLYNNDQSNLANYGYLYDWETAKNVCPLGWHLPSDAEWNTLEDYLGGWTAAAKLKEFGMNYWSSPNTGATNESGFSARPGGARDQDSAYVMLTFNGYWWTSSGQVDTVYGTNGVGRAMHYDTPIIQVLSIPKTLGFSIRCIKD